MSELYSAPLDLAQFQSEDSHSKPIELDVWSYFADHGYPVESIKEAYTVVHKKRDDVDTAHIVLKITTLERPIDEADVAADQASMWCCDCRDYQFNRGVDLSEKRITEWGVCKHCLAVDKTLKAQADENQDTL